MRSLYVSKLRATLFYFAAGGQMMLKKTVVVTFKVFSVTLFFLLRKMYYTKEF